MKENQQDQRNHVDPNVGISAQKGILWFYS